MNIPTLPFRRAEKADRPPSAGWRDFIRRKALRFSALRELRINAGCVLPTLGRMVHKVHPTTLLLLLFASTTHAAIQVSDDTGQTVQLAQPAQRIISLSPHTTELLFAAGAGAKVVGVVAFSDFPPQATRLPQVGSYNALDSERILALKPDLVVAWKSGNGATAIERLQRLGLKVYLSESEHLKDIPQTIDNLGMLAGTATTANAASAQFRDQLTRLGKSYSSRKPVAVFYQLWNQPMITINGKQIINEVIELCGGRNLFASLGTLAPTISVEAVLQANPEIIIASGMGNKRPSWLDDWKRWGTVRAVRNRQIHFIGADLINRPSPRILQGAEQMCRLIESARQQRGTP